MKYMISFLIWLVACPVWADDMQGVLGSITQNSVSPPVFIQQATLTGYFADASKNISISSSTAGSMIVVSGGGSVSGYKISSVSDNASNSYTSYNDGATWVSYTGNSGATSITITLASGSQNWSVCVVEYGNIATISAIDQYSSLNAQMYTSNPWATTSINTTFANDVLLAMVFVSYTSETTSSGWTVRSRAINPSYGQIVIFEKSVSTTGTYSATGDDSIYGNKLSSIFSFKGK